MREELGKAVPVPAADIAPKAPGRVPADQWIETVQNVMWRYAGVVRNGTGLRQASELLETLRIRMTTLASRREYEAINILQVADLIVHSALAREESRGAHFRTDFPKHDDEHFKKHSLVMGESVHFE